MPPQKKRKKDVNNSFLLLAASSNKYAEVEIHSPGKLISQYHWCFKGFAQENRFGTQRFLGDALQLLSSNR